MPSIGANCHKLRIDDRELTWRIPYHVDSEVIVILEVFEKKSRKTPKYILDICKRRLRRYQNLMKGTR